MKNNTLGTRLRAFIVLTGITIPKIAHATGISKKNLENLEKGGRPTDSNEIEVLEQFMNKIITRPKNDSISKSEKSLISIFLDGSEKEVYTGGRGRIGAIIKVHEKPALIAYPNDSVQYGNADGLVYMHDRAMEPDIKYGSIIAIKKISVEDCHPGHYYYVVTKSHDCYLRRVYIEKNKTVRLVSANPDKYPDSRLSLGDIVAAFVVEAVVFSI